MLKYSTNINGDGYHAIQNYAIKIFFDILKGLQMNFLNQNNHQKWWITNRRIIEIRGYKKSFVFVQHWLKLASNGTYCQKKRQSKLLCSNDVCSNFNVNLSNLVHPLW
jgi:hypothetical protein